MHEKWNKNKLGMESCINGKCYCEIDGQKKININKERRLMLGIYDRGIIEYVMQITTEQENHYYLSLKIMYIPTLIQQKIIRSLMKNSTLLEYYRIVFYAKKLEILKIQTLY